MQDQNTAETPTTEPENEEAASEAQQPETTSDAAPAPDTAPIAAKLPVKLEAGGQVQAIIPRDLEETAKIARGIIESGIVPRAFRHKDNVRDPNDDKIILFKKGDPNRALIIMGILKALEVGLAPLTGLSYLLPINDRFTIWGDGAQALIQAKGHLERMEKIEIGTSFDPMTDLKDWPNDYGWQVTMWRKGQTTPYVGTYTVADARRAKLWLNSDKDPWLKHPKRMLFIRARAFPQRDGFADDLNGLAIAEEVRDSTPEPIDGGELKPNKRLTSALDDE
jgi:hypothetical protein